jgi:DNA-binding NtrC family response regulator
VPHVDGSSSTGRTRVLIIATDAMVAALIGLLLDPDQFDPTFPLPRERAEDALTRVRPPLVLILDCDMDVASSDLFFARTTKNRATVVLFGSPGTREDVVELARRRGTACVHLPTNRAALTDAIQDAISHAVASGIWSIAAAMLMGALALSRLAVAPWL